jgi:hypothetical protein
LSFLVLGWNAVKRPRIGALTERTVIAFVLAFLGTVAFVLRFNSDHGYALFEQPVAALIFAVTMLVVLSIPTGWLVLFLLGRLAQAETP